MLPQYRDTADHDLLHGLEQEPEPAPTETCDLHGPWVYHFGGPGECPTCFDLSETARRSDAWWDYHTSQDR